MGDDSRRINVAYRVSAVISAGMTAGGVWILAACLAYYVNQLLEYEALGRASLYAYESWSGTALFFCVLGGMFAVLLGCAGILEAMGLARGLRLLVRILVGTVGALGLAVALSPNGAGRSLGLELKVPATVTDRRDRRALSRVASAREVLGLAEDCLGRDEALPPDAVTFLSLHWHLDLDRDGTREALGVRAGRTHLRQLWRKLAERGLIPDLAAANGPGSEVQNRLLAELLAAMEAGRVSGGPPRAVPRDRPSAIPRLTRELATSPPSSAGRRRILSLLSLMPVDARPAAGAVAQCLEDPDPDFVRLAARTLTCLARGDPGGFVLDLVSCWCTSCRPLNQGPPEWPPSTSGLSRLEEAIPALTRLAASAHPARDRELVEAAAACARHAAPHAAPLQPALRRLATMAPDEPSRLDLADAVAAILLAAPLPACAGHHEALDHALKALLAAPYESITSHGGLRMTLCTRIPQLGALAGSRARSFPPDPARCQALRALHAARAAVVACPGLDSPGGQKLCEAYRRAWGDDLQAQLDRLERESSCPPMSGSQLR